MKKNLLYILLGGAAIAAITGIVLIVRSNKNGKGNTLTEDQINQKEEEPTKASGTDVIGAQDKLPSDNFPLKVSSRGYYVLMTQARINYLKGQSYVDMDSVLGDQTKGAIINTLGWAYPLQLNELKSLSFTREMYDKMLEKIKEKNLKGYYQYLVKNATQLNSVLTKYGLKISPKVYELAK